MTTDTTVKHISVAAGILSILLLAVIFFSFRNGPLPLWDEADHIMHGYTIAQHAANLHVYDLLADSYRQFYWGFLHSWWVGISFLLFGISLETARFSSLLACCILLFMLFRAGSILSGSRTTGTLSVLLFCSSPFLFPYAYECMIEIPALAVTVLAFTCILRAEERDDALSPAAAGCSIAAVFFMKLNYGCLLILTVILFIATGPRRGDWRRYLHILAPAGITMFFWFIVPRFRLAEFVTNMINRQQGPPASSLAGILFYPSVLWRQSGILSFVYLASAVLSFRSARTVPGIRFLLIYTVLSLCLITLSQTKDARYLFPLYPGLFLMSAFHAERLLRRFPWGRTAACLVLIMTAAGGTVLYTGSARTAHYNTERARMLGELQADIPDNAPVLTVGAFNELSPSLIQWHLSRTNGRPVPLHALMHHKKELDGISHFDPERRAVPAARAFRQLLAGLRPGTVICMSMQKDSPFYNEDYLLWNEWKVKYIPLMDTMPGYTLVGKHFFNDTGILLKVYTGGITRFHPDG